MLTVCISTDKLQLRFFNPPLCHCHPLLFSISVKSNSANGPTVGFIHLLPQFWFNSVYLYQIFWIRFINHSNILSFPPTSTTHDADMTETQGQDKENTRNKRNNKGHVPYFNKCLISISVIPKSKILAPVFICIPVWLFVIWSCVQGGDPPQRESCCV